MNSMSVTKRSKTAVAICFLGLALVLYACSKSSNTGTENTGNETDDFKTGMLANYADNIILPAYSDLQAKLNQLETSAQAFIASPSVSTQESLKGVFKTAWISYESISAAYFGPASALLLNNYLNTFPTVPAKIEAGIQSGTYNFTIAVASDSIQGFPALDYLLFSPTALQKFTDPGSSNRKKYTQDIITRMKSLVNDALAQWTNGYRSSFVASLKTNVGSSIGNLVNQFAFEMDALKGPRIGWPFGKQSNGTVFADKCEGYYSGISVALAVANLTSLKKYFIGSSGNGIADYLVLLKKEQLNNDVLAQFEIALNALKAIPEPMSNAFTANPALVEASYKEVQKLLTLIKTDVASATAVQITYMDNDGD